MSKAQHLFGVLRGFQNVLQAGLQIQESNLKTAWSNSSINLVMENTKHSIKNLFINVPYFNDVCKQTTDGAERISTVFRGMKDYVQYSDKGKHLDDVQSEKYLENKHTQFTEDFEIKLSPKDTAWLKKLDMEHMEKLKKETQEVGKMDGGAQSTSNRKLAQVNNIHQIALTEKKMTVPKTSKHSKARQSLSPSAKQRTVPSSRIGRMVSFGSLAAGLGIGAAAELARRTFGVNDNKAWDSMFLTPANTDRIVNTLCKVRGADPRGWPSTDDEQAEEIVGFES